MLREIKEVPGMTTDEAMEQWKKLKELIDAQPKSQSYNSSSYYNPWSSGGCGCCGYCPCCGQPRRNTIPYWQSPSWLGNIGSTCGTAPEPKDPHMP